MSQAQTTIFKNRKYMKNINTILIILLLTSNCLKTKRAAFDLTSPAGLINFSFANFAFGQSQGLGFTVGGSIQGFTSGTLILKNGQDQLTLSPITIYSFRVASGATYSIQVQENPSGFTCSIANASGTANANISNVNISCTALPSISALYPNNGKSWNSYVKNDGTGRFQATDTACVSSVSGGYNACLHGGEMRKIDLSDRTSCSNLTASDNVNALNWICRTTSSGIQFVSTGLKTGKGLSDLIDWTLSSPSILPMNLTIKEGSNTLYQTTSSVWWDNPVVVVSPSAVNTAITISGTIYLLTSSTPISDAGNIPQVSIGVSNVAFLIKPGLRMTATAPACVTSRYMIDVVNASFSWVEGDFDASLHPGGITLRSNSYFSVIRNIKVQNTGINPLCGAANSTFASVTIQTFNNYISNVTIANSNPTGFLLNTANAKENLIYNISIFNSQDVTFGVGLRLDTNVTKNFISGVLVANNASDGVSIVNSSVNNYIFNISSVNNNGIGEKLNSSNTLLTNVMNLNNGNDHLQMNGAPTSTLQNYVSGATPNSHVNLSGGNTDTYFTGIFKVNSVACITAGGSSGGITGTCNGAVTGTRPSDINYPSTNSFLNFSATPLNQIFIGQASSESANSYYASGSNTYSTSVSWTSFQNFYRNLGKSGTFAASSSRGACIAGGVCQIYDWTFRTTDTIGLNTLPCPGNTAQLPATVVTHPLNGGGSVTFLRNAVEIIGDGIGDDNGFCQSFEACLYTPNVGSYQGHGNLVSASVAVANTSTCSDIGSTGPVTNITLYKYDTNGY